jgi:hypothetical protein
MHIAFAGRRELEDVIQKTGRMEARALTRALPATVRLQRSILRGDFASIRVLRVVPTISCSRFGALNIRMRHRVRRVAEGEPKHDHAGDDPKLDWGARHGMRLARGGLPLQSEDSADRRSREINHSQRTTPSNGAATSGPA